MGNGGLFGYEPKTCQHGRSQDECPFCNTRNTDPDTSINAARKAVGNSRLREVIYDCHKGWAATGMTDNELRASIGTGYNHGSVSKRRKDLVDAGLLADSGERRNGMIVWKLTTKGTP